MSAIRDLYEQGSGLLNGDLFNSASTCRLIAYLGVFILCIFSEIRSYLIMILSLTRK